MNIVEVAKKRDEIMASQEIYCPRCENKQYSPFDKLYTSMVERCVDCCDSETVDKNMDKIFAIINA